MRTKNKKYSLRYDGVIEVEPEMVPEMIIRGLNPSQICVTEINEDIEKFNLRSDIKIEKISDNIKDLNFDWNLPEKYLNIDIDNYVRSLIKDVNDDRIIARVENELAEIRKRKLQNLFKCIIYIIDTFKEKNIVWGIGRGSSCASYILYILGLHCVDPIKFNIPMSEFFHD
jgi:DNA polymerase III alpha subunit